MRGGLRKLGSAEVIKKEVKGKVKEMGATGAELFLRRVQCCEGWEGMWPFAVKKAPDAVRTMGLDDVEDGAALRELVKDVVKGLGGEPGNMGLEGWDGGVRSRNWESLCDRVGESAWCELGR